MIFLKAIIKVSNKAGVSSEGTTEEGSASMPTQLTESSSLYVDRLQALVFCWLLTRDHGQFLAMLASPVCQIDSSKPQQWWWWGILTSQELQLT